MTVDDLLEELAAVRADLARARGRCKALARELREAQSHASYVPLPTTEGAEATYGHLERGDTTAAARGYRSLDAAVDAASEWARRNGRPWPPAVKVRP